LLVISEWTLAQTTGYWPYFKTLSVCVLIHAKRMNNSLLVRYFYSTLPARIPVNKAGFYIRHVLPFTWQLNI